MCVWRIGGGVEGCDADTQTVALLALRVMATVEIGAKMEGSPVPWKKKRKKGWPLRRHRLFALAAEFCKRSSDLSAPSWPRQIAASDFSMLGFK